MILITIFRHYWKSIFIVVFIQYLSFASPSTFKSIPTFEIPNLDKLVHFLMFAGLTATLIWDFKGYKYSNSNFQFFVLVCILFPIFFGGLIEILQSVYFAPRTGDWYDWLCDMAGVLAAWWVLQWMVPRILRKCLK